MAKKDKKGVSRSANYNQTQQIPSLDKSRRSRSRSPIRTSDPRSNGDRSLSSEKVDREYSNDQNPPQAAPLSPPRFNPNDSPKREIKKQNLGSENGNGNRMGNGSNSLSSLDESNGFAHGLKPDTEVGDLTAFNLQTFNPSNEEDWTILGKMWFNTHGVSINLLPLCRFLYPSFSHICLCY